MNITADQIKIIAKSIDYEYPDEQLGATLVAEIINAFLQSSHTMGIDLGNSQESPYKSRMDFLAETQSK